MYPVGNIIRREGETIEITCSLDSPNYSIDDLKFHFPGRKNINQEPEIIVNLFEFIFFSYRIMNYDTINICSYFQTINDSTKMFRITNVSTMEAHVDCIVNKTGINRVTINVGE